MSQETLQVLKRETEAATALKFHLAALQADDAETVQDCIEGETDLNEALADAIKAIGEDGAAIEALKEYESQIEKRRRRIEGRTEAMRAAVEVAMLTAEKKSIETPFGTVTLSDKAPAVIVTDEEEIPARFWKPSDPKLDKKALAAALKAKEAVPGAQLSNGGVQLTIRRS